MILSLSINSILAKVLRLSSPSRETGRRRGWVEIVADRGKQCKEDSRN
jgi:hypothetical protein